MPERRIVVVEDDLDIRESLADLLTDEGYRVLSAEHGGAALALLAQVEAPCTVLLDLFMPVLDGNGFLDRLEAELPDHARASTIILLTAAPEGDALLAKVAPRVARVVRKPVRASDLLGAVAAADAE